MRVIAGTAKGRRLYAPKGMGTRPITAKIKEALFNIWQDRISGSDFLDLFAGSGSIGIEALSRGADHVVFVDKSRKAVETIKKNLEICGFRSGYDIYQDDVFRRIGWFEKMRQCLILSTLIRLLRKNKFFILSYSAFQMQNF